MIKFLRHMRKNLLNEGKTSRYIKYAIGEIILVVIGILIALAVNNWNQQKKDRRLGKDLIGRIHADLVQDTLYFRQTIQQNKLLREDIKDLLSRLYQGVNSIEQVQEMSRVYDKALDQVFLINDNTYKSMISSGTLGLIENQKLKEDIIDLYSDYDQKKELLTAINQWMLGVATTLDTQTNFIKFNQGVYDIYTSNEMVNERDFVFLNEKNGDKFEILVRAISATAFNQNVRNVYYEELIDKCHTVLTSIEKEI